MKKRMELERRIYRYSTRCLARSHPRVRILASGSYRRASGRQYSVSLEISDIYTVNIQDVSETRTRKHDPKRKRDDRRFLYQHCKPECCS
jgi:hypothetical protein